MPTAAPSRSERAHREAPIERCPVCGRSTEPRGHERDRRRPYDRKMGRPGICTLDGVIRRYDWGSTSAIQELLGLEVDGRPAAELWFGAHPATPRRPGRRDARWTR